MGELQGGRSGAYVARFAPATSNQPDLVLKVTSRRRAQREQYALTHLPSASNLLFAARDFIFPVAEVSRSFDVWAVPMLFVQGRDLRPADAHHAICRMFDQVFTGLQRCKVGPNAWHADMARCYRLLPLVKKLGLSPSLIAQLELCCRSAARQDVYAVLHGDPSPRNILVTASALQPIDFSSGGRGLVARQRARWANAIALGAGISSRDCTWCADIPDEMLVVDLLRRIESDAGDESRTARNAQYLREILTS